MNMFVKHDTKSSPSAAAKVLEGAQQRYGFVPNLAAYLAEAPAVLSTVLSLSHEFDQTSFTAREQQIILLTASTANDCSYCKAAHSALGKMAGIERDDLDAIVNKTALPDSQLEALRRFTEQVINERGWVPETDIQSFIDAGYTRAQVFEVVLGVALKTLTNYSNHLVGAEPNEEFLAIVAG